ncbi:MAG TPA: pantoate--beta-alanine ligase [Candidatus Sulfomarinibacteraceae bacterium]|nr:pantoate--beta-alanine ligase [Candidatus Sulfomarinibacteraceae bacterium]
MEVCRSIDEVRAVRWADSRQTWGLVPTMGYLHEGHLSLVRRARAENDCVAVTIYVNPTQFAPEEDLEQYPRDLERDLQLLQDEGVDLVFTPTDDVMYPHGFQTTVVVSEVTKLLEGVSRPSHFQGVTTIVAKLFNVVQPTRAYFGQKDAQQTVVVRRMVQDLNFNLEIVVCPIVREADGLAMSSRNARLKPEEREAATVLHRALCAAREAIERGQRDGDALRSLMRNVVQDEPLACLDYVSVAHPHTLQELDTVANQALLSMAVFVGEVRLIDNMPLDAPETPQQ